MRDFTLSIYHTFLEKLQETGYSFFPYNEYVALLTKKEASQGESGKTVFLRHDVDKRPGNSLATARMEHEFGIRATYYFRAVPESWDEEIIREIAALGHEIGYHYESLTTCHGDVDAAYLDFCDNLERLRKLSPVTTICMHGSPRSPYDSRDIWKKYDYHKLGIIAEPYLDTDFSRCFYLTDTGRRWDGYKVSVRDKVPHWQDVWVSQGLIFHSTEDVLRKVSSLPPVVMITTHPQRWTDSFTGWICELLLQNVKNIVKRCLISLKNLHK